MYLEGVLWINLINNTQNTIQAINCHKSLETPVISIATVTIIKTQNNNMIDIIYNNTTTYNNNI